VISEGKVVAVLDIDAKEVAAFDEVDERGLELITSMLATLWPSWK
jgi:putative methionine-R-sulfoxide reductase with GAF domain